MTSFPMCHSPIKKKKNPYIFFISINLIKFPSESKKTRSQGKCLTRIKYKHTHTHIQRECLHSWLYGAFIGGQVQDHVPEYSLSLWVAQCNEHITFVHSAGYFQDSVFPPVVLSWLHYTYLDHFLKIQIPTPHLRYTELDCLGRREDLGILIFQIS